MSNEAIEEISSAKRRNDAYKAYYAHLYEMEGHLEEIEHLEIDEIILQVCAKDREIQFGRKVAHLNSRALMQDAQQHTCQEKTSIFRETKPLFLDTAGVMCHLGALSLGPGCTAAAQAFTTASSYTDKVKKADEELLTHRYHRVRDSIGDDTQQMQSAEKEHEQDMQTIERIVPNTRRQAELIVGG